MQRLGSYELIRRLGSGGMAEVWMGRRVAGEGIFKAVAIKVVAAQRADDDRYRRMFIDEARLSMLLGHSNIVQVFDVGVHDGVSYLAMEWIDGLNLAQLTNLARVRQLPIPDAVTAYIVGELLAGLAYAHTVTHEGRALSIIHRDVSPQNVLISVSGEVKLADFGIARIAHDETSGLYVKGKLRYMAPEQLAGVSRAPTVDLYAVGAILHELLDGVRFRDGDDEANIIAQIHSGKIPTLDRRGVPPELDRLRRALLEPNPEARVQSAIAAIELLRLWPGYRNESLVVGRLCRLCLGIAAPRTGISEEPNADASSTPAVISASSTARDPGPPAPRPVRGNDRPRSIWLGISLVTLALAGVLGWSLAVRRGGVPADEPTTATRKARAGELQPSFEIAPTRRPSPAPDEAGGSSPPPSVGVDAVATIPPRGAPSPGKERDKAVPPARVEFRAGGGADGLISVFLRVSGAGGFDINFAAEPNKTMELAPGTYTIHWRQVLDAPWRVAGKIKVRSGAAYKARMTRGGDGDAKIVLSEE